MCSVGSSTARRVSAVPVSLRQAAYALGALLYHVLAGVPPYSGASSQEVNGVSDWEQREYLDFF